MAGSMKHAVLILTPCVMMMMLWVASTSCQGALALEVGYYDKTCPRAEDIVRAQVSKAVADNAGVGAGLIRLLFHDCFVEGCDASVLLDPTPANPQPEKLGLPNVGSLRGFQVIDAAKHALEEACPGTVSCADIVAFAARDASYFLSASDDYRIDFDMPAGRLDGRYSNGTETLDFLPSPFAKLSDLVAKFAAKGLDQEDMVVLSGAHSVGRAHCSSFADRVGSRSRSDDMDPSFKSRLQRRCQADPGDAKSPTVKQDTVTAAVLDSQYYANVLRHRVLLTSDAALLDSPQTARMVRQFANGDGKWASKFETAIVKMAGIHVKDDGTGGEIRKNCRFVN